MITMKELRTFVRPDGKNENRKTKIVKKRANKRPPESEGEHGKRKKT